MSAIRQKIEVLILMLMMTVLLIHMLVVAPAGALSHVSVLMAFAGVIIATYALVLWRPRAGSPAAREAFAGASPLESDLKVFLSTFSEDKSYLQGQRIWINQAQGATALNTRFSSSDTITGDTDKGILMGSRSFVGPETMHLGIEGNKDYTITWYAQNRDISGAAAPMFTLYANAQDNVGLSVVLEKDSKGGAGLRVLHGYAGGAPLVYESSTQTAGFLPFDQQYHLYTLVKTDVDLKLFIDAQDVPLAAVRLPTPTMLFSNRPMMINPAKAWSGRLVMWAAYTRGLSASQRQELFTNIQELMVTKTDSWKYLMFDYRELEKKNKALTECQLSAEICQGPCKGFEDWSSLMQKGSDNCKKAVVEYCSKDPGMSSSGCARWTPRAMKETAELYAKVLAPPPPAAPVSAAPVRLPVTIRATPTAQVKEAMATEPEDKTPVDRRDTKPVDRQDTKPVDRRDKTPVDRQDTKPAKKTEEVRDNKNTTQAKPLPRSTVQTTLQRLWTSVTR